MSSNSQWLSKARKLERDVLRQCNECHRLDDNMLGKATLTLRQAVEDQTFASVLAAGETLLARLMSMMTVVHRRVDGNFLSDCEAVDISSDLIDGATEFMSKGHWEFCTGMRVFGSLGRYEDRASQVFVEVGATDSAIRHLQPDFVRTTFTESMSVDASATNWYSELDCLKKLTEWVLCQGEYRLWHGIGLLAWSPLPIPTEQVEGIDLVAEQWKVLLLDSPVTYCAIIEHESSRGTETGYWVPWQARRHRRPCVRCMYVLDRSASCWRHVR